MPKSADDTKWPVGVSTLYEGLVAAMGRLATGREDALASATGLIPAVEGIIFELREYVSTHGFGPSLEEVFFFKTIKPAFYSEYIYLVRLVEIELSRPAGGPKEEEAFLQQELSRLRDYFSLNVELYKYMRGGQGFLDELFFRRRRRGTQAPYSPHAINDDSEFCSPCDYKVAKMLANDRLCAYLVKRMAGLHGEVSGHPVAAAWPRLEWTETLSALNEVIYGLRDSGAVNNGNVKIGSIAKGLGILFNIDPGNVYRRELENRIRKERAPFLKKMTKDYLAAKDYNDEHPHGSSK